MGRNELKRMETAHPAQSRQKFEQSHQKITLFANEWQRVSARERGKLHELTAALVRQSTTYYIDNLNILDLVENRKLSRSILESNRGTILEMVTRKAESAGGEVGKVDSKTLRGCVPAVVRSQIRNWLCLFGPVGMNFRI